MRTFRRAAAHADGDGQRLLLDGFHLVRDAYAAGVTLDTVAVTHRRVAGPSEEATFVRALEHAGVDVVAVSEPVMSALSPVQSPSGFVALATRELVGVETICGHPLALVVAAVDVQDPGNLGALLRAAEAGGATGAIVCGASAHPFSWKALRGSMGSALRLPTATAPTPLGVLEQARRAGLATIASVPRAGGAPESVDWRRPSLVFVGGEGGGLPDAIVSGCDARVTIPMQAPVESLNVAVAAALLVYEARRQRV